MVWWEQTLKTTILPPDDPTVCRGGVVCVWCVYILMHVHIPSTKGYSLQLQVKEHQG